MEKQRVLLRTIINSITEFNLISRVKIITLMRGSEYLNR
jgi:hypothetical protein